MRGEFAEIYFALSKREMQVAEIIFQCEEVSAREIQAKLSVRLANSTIRTVLRSLERKGAVSANYIGNKRIYSSCFEKHTAGDIVLRKLVNTYHNGSYAETLEQVLLMYTSSLTVTECNRISARITLEKYKRQNGST